MVAVDFNDCYGPLDDGAVKRVIYFSSGSSDFFFLFNGRFFCPFSDLSCRVLHAYIYLRILPPRCALYYLLLHFLCFCFFILFIISIFCLISWLLRKYVNKKYVLENEEDRLSLIFFVSFSIFLGIIHVFINVFFSSSAVFRASETYCYVFNPFCSLSFLVLCRFHRIYLLLCCIAVIV